MWYMEDRNRNFSLAVVICIKLCRSIVSTYTCCALWCAEALLCLSLVVSCKLCLSRFSICNSRCRRYHSMVNLAEDTFWAESVELSDLSQGLAHPGNKVELFSGLNYFSWDQFSSRLYRHLSISSMVENHLSGFAEICSALVHRHSCWYIEDWLNYASETLISGRVCQQYSCEKQLKTQVRIWRSLHKSVCSLPISWLLSPAQVCGSYNVLIWYWQKHSFVFSTGAFVSIRPRIRTITGQVERVSQRHKSLQDWCISFVLH